MMIPDWPQRWSKELWKPYVTCKHVYLLVSLGFFFCLLYLLIFQYSMRVNMTIFREDCLPDEVWGVYSVHPHLYWCFSCVLFYLISIFIAAPCNIQYRKMMWYSMQSLREPHEFQWNIMNQTYFNNDLPLGICTHKAYFSWQQQHTLSKLDLMLAQTNEIEIDPNFVKWAGTYG